MVENFSLVVRRLTSLVEARRFAAGRLARALGIAPENIYYAYASARLADDRGAADDLRYFFHGLGCTVHFNDGVSTELEFGPNGRYDAFDRYTICHALGFHIDQCDALVRELEKAGVIQLADRLLYEKSRGDKSSLESEEAKADVAVADRYVLRAAASRMNGISP